jgi:hypothetical protein
VKVVTSTVIEKLRRIARPLARCGCIAIGTVYVLVGVMALLALSGRAMGSADEERMIQVLRGLPGGFVVIWGIVAGIAGYVVWRAVEAWADPYEFGAGWIGLLKRTGIALSALAYAVIAYTAVRVAAAPTMRGDKDVAERQEQQMVADMLAWPAGDWWVGAVAICVILMAGAQLVLLLRRSYTIEINLEDRSPLVRRAIHGLAWYGYSARGVILCVLAYLLLRGAATHNPTAVGDTDTAFDTIGGGIVGDTAFFVVALGTIAYGLFMYACAMFYQFERCRRSQPLASEPGG